MAGPVPFIQLLIRRGLKADLPVLGDGELGFCEDTKEFFIGSTSGNKPAGGAYLPATPSNWSGSPPSTVSQALDRLAAAVFGLIGPIP